jgi:hypothetical protein
MTGWSFVLWRYSLIDTTYAVVGIQHVRPARERAGYEYEGHLRGLHQPAEAGFVAVAEGFSPAGIRHRVTPVIDRTYAVG